MLANETSFHMQHSERYVKTRGEKKNLETYCVFVSSGDNDVETYGSRG